MIGPPKTREIVLAESWFRTRLAFANQSLASKNIVPKILEYGTTKAVRSRAGTIETWGTGHGPNSGA